MYRQWKSTVSMCEHDCAHIIMHWPNDKDIILGMRYLYYLSNYSKY